MSAAIGARFANGWVAIEDGLDFFWKHFAPRQVDHARFTSDQIQKAVRVQPPDVAREKPAVARNLASRQPWRRIGIEHAGTGNGNLAASLGIWRDDPHLETAER